MSRWLIAATLLSVVFALDLALFGWLIFRSLSQREFERAVLETRSDAETLAKQIERRADLQGKDLYTAVAYEQETQTYIDSILQQREFVRTVEIRDRNNVLVYESKSKGTLPVGPAPPLVQRTPEGGAPHVEKKTYGQSSVVPVARIDVPIGDLGSLQIGLSPGELSKRVAVLRGDLIRQTTLIGLASLVLLLGAYAAVWVLLRRSRRLELQAAEA